MLLALTQAARVAILLMKVPEIVRRDRSLLVGPLPAGTVIDQSFGAVGDGVNWIRLNGRVSGSEWAPVAAELIELGVEGKERRLRNMTGLFRAESECCLLTFPPIERSAGRRYRLRVRVPPESAERVSLWMTPVVRRGGLALNGHAQTANLQLSIGPGQALPGTSRFTLPLGLAGFAMADLAIAVTLYALVTASDPRPE